jgi:hypothetical protein
MSSTPQHWDESFSGDHTERGWYQSSATPSWHLIGAMNPHTSAIDIGGGASVWIDEALDHGWTDLTVLDWSAVAMNISQQRLGERATQVTWIQADLLRWKPERTYDLWHDRAVLHFLLTDDDRVRYAQTMRAATHLGSTVIIGGFGLTGPDMCAGLPVRRQSREDFAALLGPEFTIESFVDDVHIRPDSATQDYVWVRAVRS